MWEMGKHLTSIFVWQLAKVLWIISCVSVKKTQTFNFLNYYQLPWHSSSCYFKCGVHKLSSVCFSKYILLKTNIVHNCVVSYILLEVLYLSWYIHVYGAQTLSTCHLAMILSSPSVVVKDETRARIKFCYSNK